MVVKVYISGISGNKEVKKRQQRVLMILDSKNIKYELIDITEPGREADKDFMQNNSKSNGGTVSDPNPRSPLPPQVFNDEEYCGDYDLFDLANEMDTLEVFVKVEVPPEELPTDNKSSVVNGDTSEDVETKEKLNAIKGTISTQEESETPIDNGNADLDSSAAAKEGSAEKEITLEKESSPVRQKSEEKPVDDIEKTAADPEIETKLSESTPVEEIVNENGTLSSREESQEKQEVSEHKTENPSEALIQSEQAIASD